VSNPRGNEVTATIQPTPASEIEMRPAPRCPECGEPMGHYGGTGGYICHDYKLLVRAGGWFDESGAHLDDRRLKGETIRDIRRH
jgi:hypothetical protein